MQIGGQGQHVRIDVLCRRQLNSEGSGGSGNAHISRRFSERLDSEPLGGTFGDFCDFWSSIGVRRHPGGRALEDLYGDVGPKIAAVMLLGCIRRHFLLDFGVLLDGCPFSGPEGAPGWSMPHKTSSKL